MNFTLKTEWREKKWRKNVDIYFVPWWNLFSGWVEEKETDFYKISVNEFFVFFVDGTGMSTVEKEKKVEKESGWDILHELDCEIKSDLYSSIYFYSCLRYFFAVLLRRKFGNRLRINNASNKLNYVNRQLRIHVITSVGKWRNKAISSRLLIVVMSASSLPMMISSRRHL